MSWFDKNASNIKKGFIGEEQVREWFKKKKIPFMQVDIMFKSKGKWCLGEIKTQEKYKAPPFDGHGLPEWQIKKRLQFYQDTGIVPYLIVKDVDDECLYLQSMIVLDKLTDKDKFKTKGHKPRVVFRLNKFIKIELRNQLF